MKKVILFLLCAVRLFAGKDECFKGDTSYLVLKHREAGGVGYDTGYTTIGTFLSPCWKEWTQPFLDLRLQVLNNGSIASNIGAGFRTPTPSTDWALGGNFYWDYRSCPSFNQIGIGFEALGKYCDIRANGYLPVGSKTQKSSEFVRFCQNSIVVDQEFTLALPSIYGEVGGYFPGFARKIDMYGALGPYYLFDREADGLSSGSSPGVRARLSAKVFDGIGIGVDVTYDNLFKTRVQGVIAISLPYGPANMRKEGKRWKHWYDKESLNERALFLAKMAQPVIRNEIIPTIEKNKDCVIANNPCNCDPFSVIFVCNTASNGDGTFESPFKTLVQAQNASCPNDLIYVFAGDGTTTGYDQGIVLKNGQALVGSGKPFDFNGINIPAKTPCKDPSLTNDGVIVDLACDTMVHGFNLIGPLMAESVRGVNVRNVTVANNCFTGGKRAVTLTSVNCANQIVDNVICHTDCEGILVSNSCDVLIRNNCIQDTVSHGMNLLAVSDMMVECNKVCNAGGTGIILRSQCGCNILKENEIDNSAVSAINLSNINGSEFALWENVINHSGTSSAVVGTFVGPCVSLSAEKNQVTATTTGVDLDFNSTVASSFTFNFNDNTVTTAGNPGLVVTLLGASDNKLESSGVNNLFDGSIFFSTGAPNHSICLFNWSGNSAASFELNNIAGGKFTVNDTAATSGSFSIDNNDTPVNTIGTIDFRPKGTPCE